jgi:hypothetical protein
MHGAGSPSVKRAAARRVAEAKARAAVDAEIARTGRIVKPGQDPLSVLEDSLADVVAIKERLGGIVGRLSDPELRYRGRAGEQLRGELAAYMASLRDVTKTAETMVKLDIAGKRAELDRQLAYAIVAMVKAALDRLDLTPEQRALSAKVVPEEMRAMQERYGAEQQNRPLASGKRPAA